MAASSELIELMAERRQEESLRGAEQSILQAIVAGTALPEILDAACRALEQVLPDSFCSILLLTPDGLRLTNGAAPNLPAAYCAAIEGAPIGPKAGSCGTAAFIGRSVIAEDIATDPLWEDYRQFALPHGLRACWSIPLSVERDGGKVLGTFATYHRLPCAPSERELDVARRLAASVAIAIQRKQLDEELIAEKEKAEAANRAKSEFLANMSHELRTPLNAILGFSELIDTQKLTPEKAKEYARDINRSGRQLLDLINDILDVARIEAGSTRINRQHCNISSIIAEQVDLVRHAFPGAATIVIADAGDLPEIQADPRAMRQVILNIVGNAAKFTPPTGAIRISVDATPPGLRVVVSDSGPGIAPDVLREIGKPFRSGEAVYSRRYGGSGLGLYISRELLRAHDGVVEIDSELERGTTVTVCLPESAVLRPGRSSAGA
ncbi:two-component system cell cycle sensor histidine kinase PleC [Dongia mobilis]|uniref:histidine kinase n=1 Tax=Dongia mobilis TaxID=578943 RepID=A0A4R6WS23_9PROT|nr:GAF domain-containing sensor histidine kinase [Dongia mobilis]TDQ82377.1 two-component system cell cycle sensor histidine kinase PleC [Dongia mobilis]